VFEQSGNPYPRLRLEFLAAAAAGLNRFYYWTPQISGRSRNSCRIAAAIRGTGKPFKTLNVSFKKDNITLSVCTKMYGFKPKKQLLRKTM
jgi:hypothetical protein